MSVDIENFRLRLENLRRKCKNLLDKDSSCYDFFDHCHLWDTFKAIRTTLKAECPGVFDDVPDRELVQEYSESWGDDPVIFFNTASLLKSDVDDCLLFLDHIKSNTVNLSESKKDSESTIPEHVRRDIFDHIHMNYPNWSGRLNEVDFLKRLYKLEEIPSYDPRYTNAAGDINQHRYMNDDWDDDWLFNDDRFNLLHCPDTGFLGFLCTTVHPVVRSLNETVPMVADYNKFLKNSGWQLVAQTNVAGSTIYGAVRSYSSLLQERIDCMHETLKTEYITKLLNRMHSSIDSDPELAIGSAKELVESVCKTVLNDSAVTFSKNDTLAQLVKKALVELNLEPDNMPEDTKALETIRPLLKSLATISHKMAELRGRFGTGHGKDARAKGLGPRHAKLAVGAASSLAVFIYETYLERTDSNSNKSNQSKD